MQPIKTRRAIAPSDPQRANPTRPSNRRRHLLPVIAAFALLVAACGDDADPADDVAVDDATTVSSPTEDTSDDDQPTTETTQPPTTDSDTDGDPGSDDRPQAFPGQCSVAQLPSQPFHAVANIEDDDPDGGLNVRDTFDDGDRLATIEEGTVVFVEDCFAKPDGSVWWSIETAGETEEDDPLFGWVNSAFLSTRIPVLEETLGGDETVELVRTVLDALAARDWEAAAEALLFDDDRIGPVASMLDDGDDLAVLLEAYCRTRVCDAPYTIGEVRGSYNPARVRPEVDVEFTYSGGLVTQTFAMIIAGDDLAAVDETTLDTLPGQSALAYTVREPAVADVVGAADREDAPAGLLEKAETVRRVLLEDGPVELEDHVAAEGIVVSSDAYVQPEAELRNVVTPAELVGPGDAVRIWGYSDGIGTALVDTLDGWFGGYQRSGPLLEPDVIAIDERVGLGNTIDNVGEIFPDARVIEFHRQGRGELSDFNWASVRLAFELRDGTWVLVAITSDSWTI